MKTPYEWGGGWYGGRADARGNVTYIDNGDDGYGIDCSGLISAAAGLAGADWGRTKRGTYGLLDYSNPVSVADLEPGDILLKPGVHVVVVLAISERIYDPIAQRWSINSRIIESSGESHKVVVNNNVELTNRMKRGGLSPRSLRN